MSEFCLRELSGYDYDAAKIALNLKKGRSGSFLYEGCGNRGVYQDQTGRLFLAKEEAIGVPVRLKEVRLEELNQ